MHSTNTNENDWKHAEKAKVTKKNTRRKRRKAIIETGMKGDAFFGVGGSGRRPVESADPRRGPASWTLMGSKVSGARLRAGATNKLPRSGGLSGPGCTPLAVGAVGLTAQGR